MAGEVLLFSPFKHLEDIYVDYIFAESASWFSGASACYAIQGVPVERLITPLNSDICKRAKITLSC